MIQTWLSDETPVNKNASIPVINVPVKVVQEPQPELATVTAITSSNVAQIASTNGHVAVETKPTIANTQPNHSKPDNPAKAAFKALLAITQQHISKVIETSIDLYGADESGTKPKFNSENMTAEQIKAVCEALMREWLGLKGYTAELAQNLIDISTSRHPGQYAAIAKDIANQLEF